MQKWLADLLCLFPTCSPSNKNCLHGAVHCVFLAAPQLSTGRASLDLSSNEELISCERGIRLPLAGAASLAPQSSSGEFKIAPSLRSRTAVLDAALDGKIVYAKPGLWKVVAVPRCCMRGARRAPPGLPMDFKTSRPMTWFMYRLPSFFSAVSSDCTTSDLPRRPLCLRQEEHLQRRLRRAFRSGACWRSSG